MDKIIRVIYIFFFFLTFTRCGTSKTEIIDIDSRFYSYGIHGSDTSIHSFVIINNSNILDTLDLIAFSTKYIDTVSKPHPVSKVVVLSSGEGLLFAEGEYDWDIIDNNTIGAYYVDNDGLLKVAPF